MSGPKKTTGAIGTARLEDDGTLVLTLRARHGGAVGQGVLRYAKDHPQYAMVLRHLGAIEPGEDVPVLPFDE